jgi:uncharacterized protein YwlG (UPF0340 family)
MKYLIVLLVMFIPFFAFAQNNVDVTDSKMDKQTQEWMKKISSNSEMRSTMIDLTKGNKEEMTKLVSTFLDDQDVRRIMLAMQPIETANRNISVEPRGMSGDSVKVMKMYNTKPILKK